MSDALGTLCEYNFNVDYDIFRVRRIDCLV